MKNDPISMKRILTLSIPTIISSFSFNVMQFLDRAFLAHYGLDDFSVAIPAGMLSFTVASLFFGLTWYVPALVAQYHGAKRPKDAARAVWQGIYCSLGAGVLLLAVSPFFVKLLAVSGRPPAVVATASMYFYLTMIAGIISLLTNCLGAFFNGRGETQVPMALNIAANVVNAVFAYVFIFGLFGVPFKGVIGAGVATLIASAVNLLLHAFFFFSRENRKKAYTAAAAFVPSMFVRLIRYGFPSALQFFIDIGGWGIFIMFVEQTGRNAMAATSIAFNIEMIAFMPVMGLATGVGIIAGQEMGARRPKNVWRVTRKGIATALGFNAVLAALFITIPEVFMLPFKGSSPDFAAVHALAIPLIRITAAWVLTNAALIVIMTVLRNAGDTLFIMIVTSVSAPIFLVLPAYLVIFVGKLGLQATFWLIVAYIAFMFVVMLARFLQGKWQSIRVIADGPEGSFGK